MAEKKIKAVVKLQIVAGAANPAPPVGTALGPQGINIQQFCTQFNEATKPNAGDVTPCEVTIYDDRSFTFILKTPPASVLIAKAAGLKGGSGKPNSVKVGSINKTQLRQIAEKKMVDLTAGDVEAGMRTIAGTARQMGVTVTE